ncbi:MAG: hypothetical protein J6X83_04170 [Methanomicrobium sp.]|nr:hypothetical protein [Kiritimatiellia bacterium]MBP5475430.1 hypothetical protein [Methanomicrobium sp.]
MALIETWYNQDLHSPVVVHHLRGNVFSQDNQGNLIGVNVFDGGAPAVLSGTVTAYVIRSDGATVPVDGVLSANTCYAILSTACYEVEGTLSVVIKLTGGGSTTTLCAVVAYVYKSITDTAVDPSSIIPNISTLIQTIDDAIDSIPADYSALLESLNVKEVFISSYETQGKYINNYGVITTTSGTYAYAQPIPVEKEKKYTFVGTGTTNIASVCKCDIYGNNREVLFVYSANDVEESFVYIPEEDGYISLSYNYSDGYSLTTIDNLIGQIIEEKKNLIDLSNIRIGENWTGSSAIDRACVDVLLEPNREYIIFAPIRDHFWSVSLIEKNGWTAGALHQLTVTTGKYVVFKTTDKTTRGIVQFNGTPSSYELTESNFTGYAPILYAFVYESNYSAIDTVARSVFDIKENMIDKSKIEIGKDWTGQSAQNRAVIAVPIVPNQQYSVVLPASTDIPSVSFVQKKDKWNNVIKSETVNVDKLYQFISEPESYWIYVQYNGASAITSAMVSAYNIFMYAGLSAYESADYTARLASLGWKGKKIVWLGTSIPAGGKDGLDNRHTYPAFVGENLRATVFNEAVGSSALHCRSVSRITENNPFGFLSNFEAVSRCITNSLEEMEYIIDHYNDSNIFTVNVPESLSDSDKAFIRSCSWENRINKYLTDGMFPDLWVFDHGHNDNPTEASEATYTARTELEGTEGSGYYVSGALESSESYSHIVFDVSDAEEVFLDGVISAGCDVYDLFDENDTLLTYKANATQNTFSGLFIDTSSADKLIVSTSNAQISGISVKKYTYGSMYNSLFSFQGAFDFIVNKIKTYNPKARIIMIGEYEDQKFPNVSHYQEIIANRWEFPLYKQWENLGWSQQLIKIDGEWKTFLDAFIPDGLHPHSDTTLFAMRFMADNISSWMETIR